MEYIGIDDFDDGYHTSTNAWDYIPNREIKLMLKLNPNNKPDFYNLLDATLIK